MPYKQERILTTQEEKEKKEKNNKQNNTTTTNTAVITRNGQKDGSIFSLLCIAEIKYMDIKVAQIHQVSDRSRDYIQILHPYNGTQFLLLTKVAGGMTVLKVKPKFLPHKPLIWKTTQNQ